MFLDSLPFAVVAHHCAHILARGGNQAASSASWVPGAGGGFLFASVALTVWWYRHYPPDDSEGNGGSGGRPPEPPPPEPAPCDGPIWWPEFEQEFAAYVAAEAENENSLTRVDAEAHRRLDGKGHP
jgi:hypothetical protein